MGTADPPTLSLKPSLALCGLSLNDIKRWEAILSHPTSSYLILPHHKGGQVFVSRQPRMLGTMRCVRSNQTADTLQIHRGWLSHKHDPCVTLYRTCAQLARQLESMEPARVNGRLAAGSSLPPLPRSLLYPSSSTSLLSCPGCVADGKPHAHCIDPDPWIPTTDVSEGQQ
jgi:hypothetical protein